jgi:glycosyltransferase involved in cell wall biosynthesis
VKLLWHSNAAWASTLAGYGNQTALVTQRLARAGHDVAISAFWGLQGAVLDWQGIRVYPGGFDPYGSQALPLHARDWFGGDPGGGVVITLVDAWVMDPAKLRDLHVGMWAPVDHETCPPRVAVVLRDSGCLPIAMSLHGEQAMRGVGLDPVYAPHGIDTQAFAPRDREECRRLLDWPRDAFVVGMVAANKGYPPRKGFPEAIAAFARFQKRHDQAVLYLHTEPHGVVQGVNLPSILGANGVPQESVRFADPYRYQLGFSQEHMVTAYSGMDVLLNPSYGEGFGIPMAEAQACGTPVISTNATSMPEVGDVGWIVGGQRMWTEQGAYQLVPDIDQLVAALGQAHQMAPRMRERARQHALTYDADRVFAEHWMPVLAVLEARMEGKPVALAPPVELVPA